MDVMKIAYLTQYARRYLYDSAKDLSYISDRRRIVGWAIDRNHLLTQNLDDEVDAAVFSVLSDFRLIHKYRKTFKVLDMVDGYLAMRESIVNEALRGAKRPDRFLKSYKFSERLRYACETVDCIVVGSPEQAELVSSFNRNVHVILDNQAEFGSPVNIRLPKNGSKFTIIWEGLSATLHHLFEISEVLDNYLHRTGSNLVVLSNELTKMSNYRSKYVSTDTLLRSHFRKSVNSVHFQTWTVTSMQKYSKIADFAIIPLNLNDRLALYKPENKLLIMLSLGVLPIVSPIYSYNRICEELFLSDLLVQDNDWKGRFDELSSLKKLPVNKKGVKDFLKSTIDPSVLFSKWDKVFNC
jgi:hypothetical protein